MTVRKLGSGWRWMLTAALLCAMPVVAAQSEGTHSKDADTASETAKRSSNSKDEASSQETKRTPFGRSKSSKQQKPKEPPAATTPFMEVEEKGDSVVFKRRTPFGIQAWTKKRSELTPEEQEMLKSHQAKQAADQPSTAGAPAAKPAAAAR